MIIDLLCAVCFDPNEGSRTAFIFATAFMTLMPLTMIGGALWYLRRRAHEIAAEESALLS